MSKGKQKYTPFKFLDYGVLCIMMTGTVTQDIVENIPREIGIEIHWKTKLNDVVPKGK